MRILYIAPHLSTGGCPQFLLKKIQVLNKEHEVYCIEYADHGRFTIQKNQIIELLKDRFISVNYDRPKLLDHIEKINPEVVHLEEMPEYFMDGEIAKKLYRKDRPYKLIETSHDSSFDPKNKVFFPDKILFVSRYQLESLKSLDIPMDVYEYPIVINPRKPREEALKVLGLDPKLKHVINVGLFTPRKNQLEIVEYARSLLGQPIQFHFVGNQADNFRDYWQPIMKNFPSNCKWWDERKDVENFYQAADLFLFTSRGTVHDKETSPLVIREAISYNIPSLIYNLPVYLGMYDKYENIEYLDFGSKDANINKILNKLGIKQMETKSSTPHTILHNDYLFQATWDINEQKMTYSSGRGVDFPIIVALREYKSDAILWSTEYPSFPANCYYWMIPIAKQTRDYEKDEHVAGIKFCVYKKDTQEQLYEEPFFRKFVNVPTISLSNRAPYWYNYSEYFVLGKYAKWLNKNTKYPVAVDIGANIGVFTEFLIRSKISRKITSVECNAEAVADLRRNYEFNDNVTVIDKALSHNNEPITFYNCPENSIISSAIPPENIAQHRAGLLPSQKTIVETITIKDLVDRLKHINLLKIDVEGSEYNVIENMDPALAEHIDTMFIECHFFEKDYKEKYRKLIERVESMGYKVEEAINKPVEEYAGSSESIFATKL
jgi:FkbM family methyltransferase